jgi:hypothetical protein
MGAMVDLVHALAWKTWGEQGGELTAKTDGHGGGWHRHLLTSRPPF